jgi:hypothetical protein
MPCRCAVIVFLLLNASAMAQDVRWINPAGGDWAVGSNWDTGSPPSGQQSAVFELPATYTVTGAGPFTMHGLRVVGGDVTLDVPEGFGFYEGRIGSSTGPLTRFRLASGSFHDPDFSLGIVEFRNTIAVCDGAPYPAGGVLRILDDADVTLGVGTGSGFPASVQIAPTGTLRASGISVGASHSFTSSGRLVLDQFSVSASSTTISGVNDEVRNSHFRGNFVGLTGMHDLLNTTFESISQAGVSFDGEILLRGSGTRVLGFPSNIMGGRVVLRDSAHPTTQITINSGGLLDISATCGARRVWVRSGGTLRIDARAQVSGPGGSDGVTTGGRMEVLLDGLELPEAPSMDVPFGLSGDLAIEVTNSNALRVGDEAPIIRFTSATSGQFSSVEVPTLSGGRQLEFVQVGSELLLRVTPGGSPCWTADFDGDGDVGTDADIEAFFACIGGTCCPACGSPDFNGDGQSGTGGDVEAFFRILGGGDC